MLPPENLELVAANTRDYCERHLLVSACRRSLVDRVGRRALVCGSGASLDEPAVLA